MTDTVKDGTLRTRRSLLTAAAGGAAALAVNAIKPGTAAAAPGDPMLLEIDNATAAPTGVTNSTNGSNALFGRASTNGRGVEGTSPRGPGVYGVSSNVSDPANNTTNAGAVGIAGDQANVADNFGLTGVYGYADPSPHADFIGAGVWGDSPDWGVVGTGSGGVLGDGFFGVFGGTASADGVGVFGASDHADGFGLVVDGRAMFSRSGKATVNAGTKKEVVNLAGCTVNTIVLAVLAQNRSGRYVRAAVPELGKFTIYLNGDVGSDTKVSWIAFSNPATGTG
jgi:hypothetical protein